MLYQNQCNPDLTKPNCLYAYTSCKERIAKLKFAAGAVIAAIKVYFFKYSPRKLMVRCQASAASAARYPSLLLGFSKA